MIAICRVVFSCNYPRKLGMNIMVAAHFLPDYRQITLHDKLHEEVLR